MRVSIVTTSKGRLHHIRDTVPRMLACGVDEVLVVDYGCPDGTGDWVERHCPGARVLRVTDDPGFCLPRARNLGARATLRRLARHTGTVVITQAELAHAVGGSRYRVGLELARLRAAGRIAVARGRITVLDVGPEPPARARRAGARGQR